MVKPYTVIYRVDLHLPGGETSLMYMGRSKDDALTFLVIHDIPGSDIFLSVIAPHGCRENDYRFSDNEAVYEFLRKPPEEV